MSAPAHSSQALRIALASDQPIYLRGLSSLIQSIPGAQMLGQAQTVAETAQLCDLTGPDLLILDLRVPILRCRELISVLHQRHPELKIILLNHNHDEFCEEEDPGLFLFSRDLGEDEFKAALEALRQDKTPQPAPAGREEEPEEQIQPALFPSHQMIPYRNQELLTRELVMAGRIQADILPEEPPAIPGWEIASALVPAHETSGDFYDFIPLSPHKWGMVIADVTDKGMGAALLMALSSTLIRTFAARFPTLPAFTLSSVSERILADTRGGMFVTAFYGILETHTGRFIYANAGHPPAILVSLRKGKETVERMTRTGMAMGVSAEVGWKQKPMRIEPGDLLVLYTDGITEAANNTGAAYGEERLTEVILSRARHPAAEIRDAVLEDVRRFSGSYPRQDDIGLVVIRREA
jgi:serine phosphatase RsbU (regulator of sigma subunit)